MLLRCGWQLAAAAAEVGDADLAALAARLLAAAGPLQPQRLVAMAPQLLGRWCAHCCAFTATCGCLGAITHSV